MYGIVYLGEIIGRVSAIFAFALDDWVSIGSVSTRLKLFDSFLKLISCEYGHVSR